MLFPNVSVVPETGWYFGKVTVGVMLPILWKAPLHCLTNCFASDSLDGWPSWTFDKPFEFLFHPGREEYELGVGNPCVHTTELIYQLCECFWGGGSEMVSPKSSPNTCTHLKATINYLRNSEHKNISDSMVWIIVLVTFGAVTIEASPDFCETWLLYCSSFKVLPEVPCQL